MNRNGSYQHKGFLHGKPIYVYDSKIECNEADLKAYLEDVNRLETLRQICELSAQIYQKRPTAHSKFAQNDPPLNEELLENAAWKAIKYCGSHAPKKLSPQGLTRFLKMCYRIGEAEFHEKTVNPDEMIFDVAYRQFPEQEEPLNLLARNYFIYFELWNNVEKAKNLDVLASLQEIVGISYEVAMIFGFALAANKTGYTYLYSEQNIDLFKKNLKVNLTRRDHLKFLEWCSKGYEYFEEYDGALNPFAKYPIVNTQEIPPGGHEPAFLLCSPANLYRKITTGTYFSLCEKFSGNGKKNPFKEKYGLVFQEYVGILLKEYLEGAEIIPEIVYQKSGQESHSVDWIILQDQKIVLIEVKQSSVFVNSKAYSRIQDIREDLRKTVVKGAKQLIQTKLDILSQKFPEFSELGRPRGMESLIVLSDPLYLANSIGRSIIQDEIQSHEIRKLRYNIINISDLEALLESIPSSKTLYEILETKSKSERAQKADFKEFNYAYFGSKKPDKSFLRRHFQKFFEFTGFDEHFQEAVKQ